MRDVRPYAVPANSRFKFEGWQHSGGDALKDYLEGWDPQTDLELHQVVILDLAGIAIDAGFVGAPLFRLTVSCTSTDTGMTEILWNSDAVGHQNLVVHLPGGRIGRAVQIRTTVTLAVAPGGPRPGIATKAGSVLGEHLHSLRLAGDAPMFPINVVDFAGTSFGSFASWHLQASEELDMPFHGTYLLLINERDKELLKAISAPKPSGLQQNLIDDMEAGVAEMMLELALRASETYDLEMFAPDSVGDVLARYVKMAAAEGLAASVLGEEAPTRHSRLAGVARSNGFGRRFT